MKIIRKFRFKLYRYDGSHCLAVVDGAPVSLVTRTSSAVDLIEAVMPLCWTKSA